MRPWFRRIRLFRHQSYRLRWAFLLADLDNYDLNPCQLCLPLDLLKGVLANPEPSSAENYQQSRRAAL